MYMHAYGAGRAEIDEGQGEIPSEQRAVDAGGGGVAVAGMGRVQRRRPLHGQRGRVHGGAQHQHMCSDEPARVDVSRRPSLQEALCHRSRSGHDHRPRLHHSRCWYVRVYS